MSNGKFFGPFASANHVDTALLEIQKIFCLRSCSDSYFENRDRPCIQYQIKRCSAPCVGKITKEEYDETVYEVKKFYYLKTLKSKTILKNLKIILVFFQFKLLFL